MMRTWISESGSLNSSRISARSWVLSAARIDLRVIASPEDSKRHFGEISHIPGVMAIISNAGAKSLAKVALYLHFNTVAEFKCYLQTTGTCLFYFLVTKVFVQPTIRCYC